MSTVARPDSERKGVQTARDWNFVVSTAESASTQPKQPETQVDRLLAQLWACFDNEWRFASHEITAGEHAHSFYRVTIPQFGRLVCIDRRYEDVSNVPVRTALQQALTQQSTAYTWFETQRREIRGIVSAIRQLTLVAASAEIQRLAEDAVQGLAARENEDIDAWARQLAQDVADATD
jgi:hypothetical protein